MTKLELIEKAKNKNLEVIIEEKVIRSMNAEVVGIKGKKGNKYYWFMCEKGGGEYMMFWHSYSQVNGKSCESFNEGYRFLQTLEK